MSKWIFTTYSNSRDDEHIKPSFCHSLYSEARNAYIFETYGATVETEKEIDCLHLDFGGMIRTTNPVVEHQLDEHRKFSCWGHQVSDAIYALEEAKTFPHKEMTICKFARWPGVLCFITSEDRDEVIEALRLRLDLTGEVQHNTDMHEVLIQANVRGRGPEEEAKVRAILEGPKDNN